MTPPTRVPAPRAIRDLRLVLGFTVCLATLAASPAGATGRDFIDETSIAEGMRQGETGIELGADGRVDIQDQLQGWFAGATEYGITQRWLAETVVKGLSRGRGLEFAGWNLETRYVAVSQEQFPVAVAGALEWEVESSAAKHLLYERVLIPRLIMTRVFSGTLLTTGNAGLAWEIEPLHRTGFAWALGARWPDRRPVALGAEVTREPLERATRITPQLHFNMGEASIRLGGSFGVHPRPYHFIARIVVERELEL
ncbi:MAG TPA: hypothetical protein VGR66_02470 [Candidatus Eisenbacteria bacterium]|nr:hypothetical protein [Candidatus Eisenbacteria bacterium]